MRRRIQTATALILIALAAVFGLAEVSSQGAQNPIKQSATPVPADTLSSLRNSAGLNGRSHSSEEDSCADCHRKAGGQEVALYQNSTHARAGLTCNLCHGGDATATEKQKAHGEGFVGLPSPEQTLSMCGSCHSQQLDVFKTSRHFPENRRSPRLDCSQCHGAHLVGSPERNFSFAYYCAGCHGQEYLPRLPEEFQKMLAMLDRLAEAKRAFLTGGRALPEDFLNPRREVRHRIAEIIHPTDLQRGVQKSDEIIRLGDELKRLLER